MSFAFYLKTIGKFPTLTHKEFLTLLKKAQAGNKRARNKIIEYNLRLVVHIAKRYRNTNISIEDLIEEGSLGLFNAIDKFKPEYKYKFSTYAVHWIKNKIARHIDTTLGQIRIPQYLTDLRRRLIKKPKRQNRRMDRFLRWADIKMVSLNTMVGENTELQDFLGTTPVMDIDLNLLLDSLDTRDKEILKCRLAGMTLEEIGKRYKLSRQRINQVEKEAVRAIKQRVTFIP